MIKGCKKNVIYLRNTDSKIFDEAYFILNDKYAEEKSCQTDILSEATRLITETPVSAYFGMSCSKEGKMNRKSTSAAAAFKLMYFLLGALSSGTLFFFISLI